MALVFHSGWETGEPDAEFSSMTGSPTVERLAGITSPTGFNDPDGDWTLEEDAYDDSTSTSAAGTCPANDWCGFLELTIPSGTYDNIRVYTASSGPYIDLIDIDVSADGVSWTNVYQGAIIPVGEWVYHTYTAQTVTKCRIRYHNTEAAPNIAYLREVDVGNTPKTGSYCMRCNTSSAQASVTKNLNTIVVSFYLYIATAPDGECVLLGTTLADSLRLTTDRYLKLYNGAALKDTGSTQLALNTWYRICLSLDTINTNAKVWLDGSEECSTTDSSGSAGTTVLGVQTSCTADLYFDDMVMNSTNSTDDLGDIRVFNAVPIAEGTHDDWKDTADGIQTYDDVDEVPASTDDWAWFESNGVLNQQTWTSDTIANLIGSIDSVKAISCWFNYKTGGGGGVDDYYTYMRDNGTDYSTSIDDPKDPTWINRYDAVMPNGGAVWTNARADAYDFGMATDDANKDMWCYAAYKMIAYLAEAGGPANYEKAVAGLMACSGAIVMQSSLAKVVLGAMTSTGVVSPFSQFYKAVLGLMVSTSNLEKFLRQYLAISGGMTSTGSISRYSRFYKTFTGAMNSVGSLIKSSQFYRTISGAMTSVGALATELTTGVTKKALEGLMAITGTLSTYGQFFKTFQGSMALAGTLTHFTHFFKTLLGNMTSSGTLTHYATQGVKIFSGAMAISGSLVSTATHYLFAIGQMAITGTLRSYARFYKILLGAMTSTGILSTYSRFYKTLQGAVAIAGTLATKLTAAAVKKALIGLMAISGSVSTYARFYSTFSGAMSSAGSLIEARIYHILSLVGAMVSTGALSRFSHFYKTLIGLMTSVGSLGTGATYFKNFLGGMASAGSLSTYTRFYKTLVGLLASTGDLSLAASFFKTLAGAMASAGALTATLMEVITRKTLTGLMAITGTLSTYSRFYKLLSGALAISGTLTRFLQAYKVFSGVMASTGTLTRFSQFYQVFTGTMASVGSLEKYSEFYKVFAGLMQSTGVLSTYSRFYITLSGVMTSIGSLPKRTLGHVFRILSEIRHVLTMTKRTKQTLTLESEIMAVMSIESEIISVLDIESEIKPVLVIESRILEGGD